MSAKEEKFPWDIGTKINFEVMAKDFDNAWINLHKLIKNCSESSKDFHLLKLRVLQLLTNINRASFDAGANPVRLFKHSLSLLSQIDSIVNEDKLIKFAKKKLFQVIAMVPEKDYWGSDKVNKALKYINGHCEENVNREEVAGAVGCSSAHLGRLFREVTGQTFKETVIKIKMDLAKKYLEQSDIPVTLIAFKVGFKDSNYFSLSFKKNVGLTPMQYRKKIKCKQKFSIKNDGGGNA